VIDTNVLVSAALRNRTPEAVILFVAGSLDWVVSADILLEYRSVLRRPRFALPKSILERWDTILDTFTTVIDISLTPDFPRDQGDAKFIACALASQADFLVTGDRDYEEARKLINTTILSVSAFKRLIIDTAVD
jgi:putative PIN family toxin of toxin-antitoxin system